MVKDGLISTTSVSPRRRRESFRSARRSIAIKLCLTSSVTQPLDDEIKVVTEVYQEPIRKDYTVLIKSTVDCIRALEFRMNRAQSDFQKALKCPGTDPDLINRHATRLRLITATLANRMNELITLLGEGHEKDG